MGRLKRRIDNQFAIEWRSSEDPPILESEVGLVEIVEAAGLVKPQAQLDAEATTLVAAIRQTAHEAIAGSTSQGAIDRALVLALIDELNDLRLELRTMKVNAAAAANTIAGMKGIFSAIRPMLDRNGSQAITAMKNKITNGLADN